MKRNKTVVLAGCWGYIGNALCQRLLMSGYKVIGIDNGSRDKNVHELGSYSATPRLSEGANIAAFCQLGDFEFYNFDISTTDAYYKLIEILTVKRPGTFVNLAHMPSAPFSQIDVFHANNALSNNLIGTSNILWAIKEVDKHIHYVTIGTTGEYFHSLNVDIEEGRFSFDYNGRKSKPVHFPRQSNSSYHTAKVASFYLTDYLCRIWGLTATESEQAVVFGLYTKETDETKLYSRFDTDAAFGTVCNKFIIHCLLGEPMIIYGKGEHKRGFLALQNSVDAEMLLIENPPPEAGQFRIANQLSEQHSMNELANLVKDASIKFGINSPGSVHIESPRCEDTNDHYYNIVSNVLPDLGYIPSRTITQEVEYIFKTLDRNYIKHLKNTINEQIYF